MKINVPQICSVDMLLVGGTQRGLLAAMAAKRLGNKIFCITPEPYFAEFSTTHFDLQGKDDPIWNVIFSEAKIPTPMDVKRKVELLLMDNGIDFLYQIHPVCPAPESRRKLLSRPVQRARLTLRRMSSVPPPAPAVPPGARPGGSTGRRTRRA